MQSTKSLATVRYIELAARGIVGSRSPPAAAATDQTPPSTMVAIRRTTNEGTERNGQCDATTRLTRRGALANPHHLARIKQEQHARHLGPFAAVARHFHQLFHRVPPI